MKQPGDTLARNLQKIREGRSLSLDKLADLTGVSKSMLRQIEIGQSSPTIATIWKIANGLKIPFTAMLKEQTQEVVLQPFKQDLPLVGDSPGYRLYPLIAFDPERSFEVYFVEIDPGIALEAEPHQGNAEEKVFVVKGQIDITVDGQVYEVDHEHFISFRADCVHSYHNSGEEIAVAFMLISYLGS